MVGTDTVRLVPLAPRTSSALDPSSVISVPQAAECDVPFALLFQIAALLAWPAALRTHAENVTCEVRFVNAPFAGTRT